jgi:hypothetical protein
MFTHIDAPADYQVWIDQSAHKIKNHLTKEKISFEDSLDPLWSAAPYASIWKSRYRSEHIWIFFNDSMTDVFVDSDIVLPRQAAAFFSYRFHEVLPNENGRSPQMKSHAKSMGDLLDTLLADDSAWEDVV